MGVMDNLDVVETVGFLNSRFPHQTTKILLELQNEYSKTAGYKSIHKKIVIMYTNNEPSIRKRN